jgi:hypothetical protein
LDKSIDNATAAGKQDKLNTENLILGDGDIVQATNEAFYNIWNPVHYDEYKSSSESKIVLTENGELKLIWKYGGSEDSTEKQVCVQNEKTGKTVQFAD